MLSLKMITVAVLLCISAGLFIAGLVIPSGTNTLAAAAGQSERIRHAEDAETPQELIAAHWRKGMYVLLIVLTIAAAAIFGEAARANLPQG